MQKPPKKPTPPTVAPEVLQPLFDAAARFRELEPWTDLYDSDMVAVIDPQSQAFLVLAVMGKLREVFALVAYREREGIEFCRRALELREGEDLNPNVTMTQLNALMADFIGKRELDKTDRRILDQVNWPVPKGRAHPRYVQFRSYRPHFAPWYIDSEEARLLTLALDRMSAWFQWRIGESEELRLNATPESLPIYRRLGQLSDPDSGWKLTTGPLPSFPQPPEELDLPKFQETIDRIKDARLSRGRTWELRAGPEFTRIMEGERPFYPSFGLVVEADSGLVLGAEMMRPEGTQVQREAEILLKTIESRKLLPSIVLVEHEHDRGAVKMVCEALGILLQGRPVLPELEAARQAFSRFLNR